MQDVLEFGDNLERGFEEFEKNNLSDDNYDKFDLERMLMQEKFKVDAPTKDISYLVSDSEYDTNNSSDEIEKNNVSKEDEPVFSDTEREMEMNEKENRINISTTTTTSDKDLSLFEDEKENFDQSILMSPSPPRQIFEDREKENTLNDSINSFSEVKHNQTQAQTQNENKNENEMRKFKFGLITPPTKNQKLQSKDLNQNFDYNPNRIQPFKNGRFGLGEDWDFDWESYGSPSTVEFKSTTKKKNNILKEDLKPLQNDINTSFIDITSPETPEQIEDAQKNSQNTLKQPSKLNSAKKKIVFDELESQCVEDLICEDGLNKESFKNAENKNEKALNEVKSNETKESKVSHEVLSSNSKQNTKSENLSNNQPSLSTNRKNENNNIENSELSESAKERRAYCMDLLSKNPDLASIIDSNLLNRPEFYNSKVQSELSRNLKLNTNLDKSSKTKIDKDTLSSNNIEKHLTQDEDNLVEIDESLHDKQDKMPLQTNKKGKIVNKSTKRTLNSKRKTKTLKTLSNTSVSITSKKHSSKSDLGPTIKPKPKEIIAANSSLSSSEIYEDLSVTDHNIEFDNEDTAMESIINDDIVVEENNAQELHTLPLPTSSSSNNNDIDLNNTKTVSSNSKRHSTFPKPKVIKSKSTLRTKLNKQKKTGSRMSSKTSVSSNNDFDFGLKRYPRRERRPAHQQQLPKEMRTKIEFDPEKPINYCLPRVPRSPNKNSKRFRNDIVVKILSDDDCKTTTSSSKSKEISKKRETKKLDQARAKIRAKQNLKRRRTDQRNSEISEDINDVDIENGNSVNNEKNELSNGRKNKRTSKNTSKSNKKQASNENIKNKQSKLSSPTEHLPEKDNGTDIPPLDFSDEENSFNDDIIQQNGKLENEHISDYNNEENNVNSPSKSSASSQETFSNFGSMVTQKRELSVSNQDMYKTVFKYYRDEQEKQAQLIMPINTASMRDVPLPEFPDQEPIKACRIFEGEFFTIGFLTLPPKSKKSFEYSECDEVFLLFSCEYNCININFNKEETLISNGTTFVIPRGNAYKLENLSEKIPAHFFFTFYI